MSFKDTWGHAGRVARVILIFIILYALFSVYFLFWTIRVVPGLTTADTMGIDTMWIVYAIVSFVLVTVIAAFHLSVMMFRRNKDHDHAHTGTAS